MKCGRGLPAKACRRRTSSDSWKNCPIILEDLKEETMSMEADVYSRLGEPNQVAEAAVAAYRRRSFLGRHSTAAFLVFGLSPIAASFFLACLCIAAVWGVNESCNWIGVDTEQGLRNLKRFEPLASVLMPIVLSLIVVVIPSILASVFYCRLARHLALGRKWMIVSCLVLATLALMPICSARLSDSPGKSRLAIGVVNLMEPEQLLRIPKWSIHNPRQLVQLLVPLAIGCWYLRRPENSASVRVA